MMFLIWLIRSIESNNSYMNYIASISLILVSYNWISYKRKIVYAPKNAYTCFLQACFIWKFFLGHLLYWAGYFFERNIEWKILYWTRLNANHFAAAYFSLFMLNHDKMAPFLVGSIHPCSIIFHCAREEKMQSSESVTSRI